jgi:hypothetical protein
MKIRLVLAGTLIAGLVVLLIPTATAAAPAATNIVVTAAPSTTLVQTHTWFRITGTVVHPNSPKILRLQQYMKRAWTNVAYAHMTKVNTYSILAAESQIGTAYFRVAIFKSNSLPKPKAAPLVVSPTFSVAIATWTFLEKWNSDEGGGQNTGHAEINGVTYNQSLRFSGNAAISDLTQSVGYNLARRCYRLKAVVGIDDNSPSGSVGEFVMQTDGNSVFDNSLGLGQDQPISFDVADVMYLDLLATFRLGPAAI